MAHHSDESQEEGYELVYNMWITNMTIHANQVIMQTGEPESPPPPPPSEANVGDDVIFTAVGQRNQPGAAPGSVPEDWKPTKVTKRNDAGDLIVADEPNEEP